MSDAILKGDRFHEVVFGQDVVADDAARLAMPRHPAEPLEHPVVSAVAVTVLDVVPDAHHDRQQFVADGFLVLDSIHLAAIFDPPVAVVELAVVAVMGEVVLGELAGESGRAERHRRADILGDPEQRGTHGLVVRALGIGLVEFVRALAADPTCGTGLGSQASVTSAVNEEAALDDKAVFGGFAGGFDLHNAPFIVGLRARAGGVEVEGEAGLVVALLVEDKVPHLGAALGIADGVFEADFVYDARFAVVGPRAGVVCAAGMDADLTRGVPAEHRPVVNQNRPDPVARSGQGSTDP